MIQDVYVRRMIQKRKDNGLCVKCGNKLDRKGALCVSCKDKMGEDKRITYHWYQDAGICPVCKVNSILGDEKTCPECRAYKANQADARRNRDRDKYNLQMRSLKKKMYYIRKEQGLCVCCGKELPNLDFVRCKKCRNYNKERKRISREKDGRIPNQGKERINKGLCYFCENKAKLGYKVCDVHYKEICDRFGR